MTAVNWGGKKKMARDLSTLSPKGKKFFNPLPSIY